VYRHCPQVPISHPPVGRLQLLSARPVLLRLTCDLFMLFVQQWANISTECCAGLSAIAEPFVRFGYEIQFDFELKYLRNWSLCDIMCQLK